MIAFGRPYTPDFLGWFDDFSTTGGGYDALGGIARTRLQLTTSGVSCHRGLAGDGQQYKRCPGASEAPRPTGRTSARQDEHDGSTADERATGDVDEVRRVAT